MEHLLPEDILMADASAYRMAVDAFANQNITEDEFRALRGIHGIHRQRGGAAFMARVKAPGGRLSQSQVEALADIAGLWSRQERLHLTTRQDFQIYGLQLHESGEIMEALAEAGLACLESGGASVRNLCCPPESGLIEGESFDPFPWALGLARALAGREEFRGLPRKFKVAFASEAGNLGQALSCDLGFIARTRKAEDGSQEQGFEIHAGGGLGVLPRLGILVHDFLPAHEILDLAEAVLRHFNARGNRKDRVHSRMKFLVEEEGPELFRQRVAALRRGRVLAPARWDPQLPSLAAPHSAAAPPAPWLEQNVFFQKQEGYAAVKLRLPQGDVHPSSLGGLAKVMRRFRLPELRLGLDQNLCLPWVPAARLGALHLELAELGLEQRGAGSAWDVVSCAGPDTCNRGLVNSRALARDIEEALAAHGEPLGGGRIHVSGCGNGCGHHLLAAFGLQGTVKKVEGRPSPHYRLSLAGQARGFGRYVMDLPARQVAPAMKRLMQAYQAGGTAAPVQTLRQWSEALPADRAKEMLADLGVLPGESGFRDAGSDVAFNPGGFGASEC